MPLQWKAHMHISQPPRPRNATSNWFPLPEGQFRVQGNAPQALTSAPPTRPKPGPKVAGSKQPKANAQPTCWHPLQTSSGPTDHQSDSTYATQVEFANPTNKPTHASNVPTKPSFVPTHRCRRTHQRRGAPALPTLNPPRKTDLGFKPPAARGWHGRFGTAL